MKLNLLLLAWLLLLPWTAAAQQGGAPPPQLPGSTRALGLGNAYPLSVRESAGLFYNPAAVDSAGGVMLAVQRYAGAGTLATLSGAELWGGGTVAVGLQALGYAPGPGSESAGEAALLGEGPEQAGWIAASVAYTRPLRGWRVGAGAKLLEWRPAGGAAGQAAALDVGVLRRFGRITAGAAVQDLDLGLSGAEVPVPTRFTLGASSARVPLGPLDVLGTSALTYRSGELAPAAGLEVAYWPVAGRTFVGRVGVRRAEDRRSPFTLGAGFTGDRLSLEYAYHGFDGPSGAAHRFGIGWQ